MRNGKRNRMPLKLILKRTNKRVHAKDRTPLKHNNNNNNNNSNGNDLKMLEN